MALAKILLADDHVVVAQGLRGVLESDFEIVGIARDGVELVEEALRTKPDAIVVDVAMPLLNGLDAMRKLVKSGFKSKYVFLTANPDVPLATQVMREGASAYVLKTSAGDELVTAVRQALNGGTYVSSFIADDVMQNLLAQKRRPPKTDSVLTQREREVLQLLAEGKSVKEAGAVLEISPRTVEFHKYNVMQKIGVHTTAELARYALKLGLVAE